MNICTALWSFVNFCCLSQSEVSTDNRKVSTFLAFQIVRCRCCYRSYLDRFLISSTSTTPKCTLHFNFDRPQTGLPCDRADRACYSNITADHFYSVSAKKPNRTLIEWSTAHHFQLQGEFLGNLHQCCNSFTGNKIVSYIKEEDGPVFTVRYYVI